MWLFSVAVLLAVLKALVQQEIVSFTWLAQLSWWWVIGMFGLAAAWWAYADASGLTRRKAQERIDERKKERQRKAREALGHASQRQRR